MSGHNGAFEEQDTEAETPRRDRRFGERGGGLVEYGLLTALIALACISALGFFGSTNENSIDDSAQTVTEVIQIQ